MVTLTHLRSMHLEVVLHLGAKKKHGFRKWGVPQIIQTYSILVLKPMILGYHLDTL